jgi:hypothetical protein
MIRVAAQPAAGDPFLAACPAEHLGRILRVLGVGDTAVEIAFKDNQASDQRVVRPRLAAIFPGREVAVVDAEMHVPRIAHRVVPGRASGQMEIDAPAAFAIELGQNVAEHAPHRHVRLDPNRDGEIPGPRLKRLRTGHLDDTVAAVEEGRTLRRAIGACDERDIPPGAVMASAGCVLAVPGKSPMADQGLVSVGLGRGLRRLREFGQVLECPGRERAVERIERRRLIDGVCQPWRPRVVAQQQSKAQEKDPTA